MKQGIEMFLRAITQLVSNLWAVIWATGPAWVILSVATSAAAFWIVGDPSGASTDTPSPVALPPYFWTYFLISQVLNFLTLGYIGPKFHRAILPENTSDLPLPYLSYIFALMKLGLIGIGLAFLASRIISFIAPTVPGPLGELTLPILFMIAILYVMLRFALVLPAIAMSRPRDMNEAWRATRAFRYSGLLSLLLLIVTIAILHSLTLILKLDAWSSLIVSSIASWFALMILLSYLNVIYRDARKLENRMARQR